MAEDQTQFCETSARGRGIVENFILCFLEKTCGLFAFVHEVLDKELEELVVVQERDVVLVLLEDSPKVLVGVREDIQNERRTVLQIHATVCAQIYDFVHELPCFLDSLLVHGRLGLFRRLSLYSFSQRLNPVLSAASHLCNYIRILSVVVRNLMGYVHACDYYSTVLLLVALLQRYSRQDLGTSCKLLHAYSGQG